MFYRQKNAQTVCKERPKAEGQATYKGCDNLRYPAVGKVRRVSKDGCQDGDATEGANE